MPSLKQRFSGRRLFRAAMATVAGAVLVGTLTLTDAAARDNTVVVFTANWCANCREIVPIAREISGQNGLSIVVVDVDTPSAPKEAKSMGLEVPTRTLPQVYLFRGGQARLIFDGSSYIYGQQDAVRSSLMRGIQGR